MMDQFEIHLNDLLTRMYRSVELMEEQMLRSSQNLNLSISEIHLLEAVGSSNSEETGRSISELSSCMGISLPSVTAAINKLAAKGYVEKRKAEKDGRVVYVYLTKMGRKADLAHRYFHKKMVNSISASLTEDEKKAMLKGMEKLSRFFDNNLKKKGEHA